MKNAGLTAKQIEHLKPAETRVEIPVGNPPGLYLVIQPSGAKSWALRYRWHGRAAKLTLGVYPSLTLAGARGDAQNALATLKSGNDPAAAKAPEPNSAEAVLKEWLARDVWPRTRTGYETERRVNKDILPTLKGRLITEVGRPDILRMVDAIVDRGSPMEANEVLSIAKRWLNWCVERGYIESSPAEPLKPPADKKHRDRVLTDEEVREVWNATATMGYPNGPFLRLLILTAQRRGEVAEMTWDEIDGDLWTLAQERTKSGRVHDVPLSTTAMGLLESLPRFTGPHVFTNGNGDKPINSFSKLAAALDTAIKKVSERATLFLPFTLHDFRRTAATYMAKSGFPPHVVAALLNHSPGSQQGITAIYNRHRYSEERRAALEAWGKHVAELAAQKAKQRRTA